MLNDTESIMLREKHARSMRTVAELEDAVEMIDMHPITRLLLGRLSRRALRVAREMETDARDAARATYV